MPATRVLEHTGFEPANGWAGPGVRTSPACAFSPMFRIAGLSRLSA